MAEVKSPCIGVCIYDAKDEYCTGCFRSLKDIQDWWEMSDSEKREALQRCKKNKARDRRGRHGRAKQS